MVDISKEMCLLIHLLAKKKDHDPLTIGPEPYQDGIGCSHLYHSYEENELENTGVYTVCAVTLP
jgi:hypothetical protein